MLFRSNIRGACRHNVCKERSVTGSWIIVFLRGRNSTRMGQVTEGERRAVTEMRMAVGGSKTRPENSEIIGVVAAARLLKKRGSIYSRDVKQ